MEEIGAVKISNDVIATVAYMAAMQVEGVVGISAGIVDGITKFFGTKSAKGIKVSLQEGEARVDVAIRVEYGANIPEVAWRVQENVKRQIEQMTGLFVQQVNVYIQGISKASLQRKG
jgi:uncharacterized alkaline shock family protein YloU